MNSNEYLPRPLSAIERNNRWGFINVLGEAIIPCTYIEVMEFSEDFAAVKMLHGKWGFINIKGDTKVPMMYDDVLSFSEGCAAVYLNGKWGYIDKQGKTIIEFKYEKATSFSDSLAQDITRWYFRGHPLDQSQSITNLSTNAIITKNNNTIPMLLAKVRGSIKIESSLYKLMHQSTSEDVYIPRFRTETTVLLIDLAGTEYQLKDVFGIPEPLRDYFPSRLTLSQQQAEYEKYEAEQNNDWELDNDENYGTIHSTHGGYNGHSDDVINDAFEGDPENTWNTE